MSVVTLHINDELVSARSDQKLLEVIREQGIDIPTLCHLEGVSDLGGCRLCLVEIQGSSKLLAACVTPVQEGMSVYTHSERLVRYRRMILELLLSERTHTCAVCVSNGHCELQSMAQEVGMTHVGVPYLYPKRSVDASHERFVLDHNRCVLCTRCVRVCGEIEGAHTWDVKNRGIRSLIVADFDTPWGQSETCTGCGKCVQVCPTGALFEKGRPLAETHKKRQFLPYLMANRAREQR